ALLLELEDFEITVNYSDGTSTTVGIGDCTISGFDPDVEGEQEITVSFGGKSVSFAVYVYSADNFIPVEGISLNKTAVTIEAGGSETLAAVFDPEDATEKRVRWESDNPALAAVNVYGVINVPEDAEEGTATITVTTIDGDFTAECVVTVTTDGEPVQNLENLTVGLTAGDGKVTLAAQAAAAGFAFYYNKSAASVTAPAYGDAITTIPDAAEYNAATDIPGTNGTAIYVQVYKVETTGNTIVGFGQANRIPTATPDNIAPIPGNSGTITTASVTDNSLIINWTKATDDVSATSALRYFVYQKTSAFTMVSGLPTDGTLLNTSGTLDIATFNVSSLLPGTTYFFIVVVEDEAGNKAAYTAKSETTAAAPVLENLTVSLTAGDGKVTLAAQTAATGFAFYYNKSAASVTAPAYGAAIATITGATAYTAATDISGANGTAIYVQVYKVETTGNTIVGFGQANRTPEAAPDTTPPTPGNSGTITTASVTTNSLTLNWAKATDDITAPASLLYFVYQKDSAFTMSGGLPTDGTLLNPSGTADIATFNVSALSAGTTYYFIVVVEDEAGNRAAYTAKSETTNSALTYEISATTLTSFGSLAEGYTQPSAQTVTVTNTGTDTVTLNQPTAADYDIGTLSTTSLAAGATATFTVQPKAGLAEGNYNETINITGSNDAETSVDAEFTVSAAKSLTVGTQIGTVNAGTGGDVNFEVTTVSIAAGSYPASLGGEPAGVSVKSDVVVGSDGKGTLTLTVSDTVAGGNYPLTVSIDGAAPAAFGLVITDVAVTGITLTPNPLTVVQGGTAKFTVAITPSDATDKSVTWETASTNITIASDGTITGVTAITGIIVTARSVSNPTVTGSAYVNVVSVADQFEKDGIYYSLISSSNVRVTNKQYGGSGDNRNTYSGAVVVPATVEYGGITYNVTEVHWEAFMETYGTNALTSVTLPNSITQIGNYAFANCGALTTLNLPEGLLSIGAYAFSSCTDLASLHLPASLNSINSANPVFVACENLSITVASGSTVFSVDASGVLYEATGGNPQYYLRWIPEKLTGAYTIPAGVVSIGTQATARSQLTEIRIPASVTAISGNNFQECANLTDIWLNWTVPPTGITPSFSGTTIGNITLYVPAGTLGNYAAHSLWQNFTTVEQP
ncbi:MAG: leucine-rich repeat protein, partial [Treponema sp.]|nr:leucine-rich repeat protein [Treponema sp.]